VQRVRAEAQVLQRRKYTRQRSATNTASPHITNSHGTK